jgi:hypothetical protein
MLTDHNVSIKKRDKELIEMKLDMKTIALIAVGASTAANCTGCLEKTVSMSKEAGADEKEVGEAVMIGRRVRAGAASKFDQLETALSRTVFTSSPSDDQGCSVQRLIRRAQRTPHLETLWR